MQHHALDHVVRRVRDGDHVSTRPNASALQEVVTKRARGGLDRASRQRAIPPLDQRFDAEAPAQRAHVLGHQSGGRLWGMVVMGGDESVPVSWERDRQGGAVGSTRNRHQHAIRRRDQPGSAEAKQYRVGGVCRVGGGHGGAGWTRTTDNAIMSRALYRLSYGTPAPRQSLLRSQRSCFELGLLSPVLRDRDTLSLVQPISSNDPKP